MPRIETEVDQWLPGECRVMGVTANGNGVLPRPRVFVYVVHAYMFKCVGIRGHTCAPACGSHRLTLGVFFNNSLHLLTQGILLNPEFAGLDSLATQFVQSI